MSLKEDVRKEIQTGLQLIAYKAMNLEFAPLGLVEETLKANHWDPISAVNGNGLDADYSQYYYSTAMKTFVHVACSGYTGACSIQAADESEVLDRLTFPELKRLGNMIDKKSVAFIRIYSQKELEAASSEEERNALNERKQKMIDEAEVALRKR